jgi:phosphatidylinositol glycan class W
MEPIKLNSEENEKNSQSSLDTKVVKLSINLFRSTVVIITSIAILAVDFKIFSRRNAKTEYYGISLMDVGVGYFIMCHSMRLIRNSLPEREHDQSNSLIT